MTPDAIGPRSTEFLLVTRHLVAELPEDFGTLRPVAALAAGVTGSTGMESGEILGAVVEKLHPACLIAVDALAARLQGAGAAPFRSPTRDRPRLGVGNARMALDQAHLGIPVIAIGVPHRGGGRHPLPGSVGGSGELPSTPASSASRGGVVRHPRNIDREVETLARILGLGISTALHVDFSVEDVEKWIS